MPQLRALLAVIVAMLINGMLALGALAYLRPDPGQSWDATILIAVLGFFGITSNALSGVLGNLLGKSGEQPPASRRGRNT